MDSSTNIFREPDLSDRPYSLIVEREMDVKPEILFKAWTKEFDMWFAAPDSVLMVGLVNTPFFFETEYEPDDNSGVQRYPHYGRFLQVIPNQLVQMTWLTGEGGTNGAETVVTVEIIPKGDKTVLRLTHSGFPEEALRDGHEAAWPMALEILEWQYQ